MSDKDFPFKKTDEEWLALLGEHDFNILRKSGTERAFTGEYNLNFSDGSYRCKGCQEVLFASGSKFDHGCGWPSFDREIESGKILEILDTSHGMVRKEIVCANCGSHLGHVFDDGPTETGIRYCVNSASIDFEDQDSQ